MIVTRAAAPTLQGLREASERWVRREHGRPRLTSGATALDTLLDGGWPQGKAGELIGPTSSGRSAAVIATVAAATDRGEVVAWLDAPDVFDPASAATAGVDLGRVLWVRPRGVEEAVRAAELVLEVGGFTVVVLDLGLAARRSVEGRPGAAQAGTGLAAARKRGVGALRLRLVRAVERAGAVALVLADRPWLGTLAGTTVVLGPEEVRWGECGKARWLAGISLKARVERGGARVAVRHDPSTAEGVWGGTGSPASDDRRALGA
jgi:hypothetical protein